MVTGHCLVNQALFGYQALLPVYPLIYRKLRRYEKGVGGGWDDGMRCTDGESAGPCEWECLLWGSGIEAY